MYGLSTKPRRRLVAASAHFCFWRWRAELVAVRRVLVGVFPQNPAGLGPVSGPQVLGTDAQAHALVVVRIPPEQLLHQAHGFGPFSRFQSYEGQPVRCSQERPVVESDPLDPSVEVGWQGLATDLKGSLVLGCGFL